MFIIKDILMKLFQRFYILLFIVLLAGFQACDDDYKQIDYSKYFAEEDALLKKYLSDTVRWGDSKGEIMARLDSLTKASIDTVDNYKDRGGIIYFSKEIGIGEPVTAGKMIGYRYKAYGIVADSVGVPYRVYAGSNYSDLEPAFAIAGQTSSSSGYYTGLNDAIMLMNHLGKASVILPSPSGNSNFVTYIYDLEVVYIQK